jgi:hypothetical protein
MTVLNPLFLQNKLYPARQFRQLIEAMHGGVEQVLSGMDPSLVSGTQTQVGVGDCLVRGDTAPGLQGLYHLKVAAAETQVHTRDGTNPRVNAIVAKIHDSTEVGSGSDVGAIEIAVGTPTAGANLTNRNGAPGGPGGPAFPDSALHIADALVPPTGGGDATIADMRPRTRGKSIVATEQSRSNTAYGTLPTPDQVPNVVLPDGGLLRIAYQASWKNSVANAGRAAIFIGSNQLKAANQSTATSPTAQEASLTGAVGDRYAALAAGARGLVSMTTTPGAYTGDVTTGQILGVGTDGETSANLSHGGVVVFAAPGTYTISVQFKSSSGSVTVKERKLWVEAIGF